MRKLFTALLVMGFAVTAMAQPTTNLAGGAFQTQNLTHKYTDESGATTTESFNSNVNWTVANGTAADQMTKIWRTRVTMIESATKTFDLAGGLTNRFGIPFSFTAIKYIQINGSDDNTGSVSLGNEIAHWATWIGATNQTVTIRPDSACSVFARGTNNYAVTATTGDLFKLTNNSSDSTNIVDIVLGGI